MSMSSAEGSSRGVPGSCLVKSSLPAGLWSWPSGAVRTPRLQPFRNLGLYLFRPRLVAGSSHTLTGILKHLFVAMLKTLLIAILAGAVLIGGLPERGWSAMWDCGPAAMVVQPKGGGQWWVSSSNIYLLPVYASASSSGTSDCSGFGSALHHREFEQQKYLLVSWEELSEETAQGGGPHLSGLATLMGCPDGHRQVFAEMLRKDYDSVFVEVRTRSQAPAQLRTRITALIQRHPQLADNCNLEG